VSAKSASPATVAASNGAPPTVPEFLPNVINCKQEEDPVIRQFADNEKIALIGFIAPQVPVRISPADTVSASIGLLEEFGVEALVAKLREKGVKRAYMLVNSPGGQMDSSYKIALAVREALDDVTSFVPHVAASGGTLLTIAGNEIVMGPMSHITPLDTQVRFRGTFVSAASSQRFYRRAVEWFEKKTPEEAPYPQRALTEKLDPYLMEEWIGILTAMQEYVTEVLGRTGYENAAQIAARLVTKYPTHSYVLNGTKAKEVGLNVVDANDRPEAWKVMRYWLSKYLIEQQMTHCIRYVIPDGATSNGSDRTKKAKQARRKPAKG
jgi:ATP-dependent protease ClpP protease subunit